MDDEALFRQVMQGEEAALEELVARYHSPIYKFLCRYCGDFPLAEDLVQETFTRLLTYHGQPPARFKAWVYTIATNLARDHFKTARYRLEQQTDFAEDDYPDEFNFSIDMGEDVSAALARLSPDHREVVILRFYHDLKLEEIAEVTDAPIGTVKSRLFHALKVLKGFLAVTGVVYDRF